VRVPIVALSGLALLALTAGMAAPVRAAGLVPTDQSRGVHVAIDVTTSVWTSGIPPWDPPDETDVESFSDAATAPDFAPFSATAAVSGFPDTSAAQESSITGHSIAASGSIAGIADIESTFPPEVWTWPFSQVRQDIDLGSSLSVDFSLEEPSDYTLSGQVDISYFLTDTRASIRLIGPGPSVIAEVAVESDPDCIEPACFEATEPIEVSGSLAPGTYTLEAMATGEGYGFYSTAAGDVDTIVGGDYAFTFSLARPVPALSVAARALLALLLALFAAGRLASDSR
jgi:hypothetical protein